jgi:transcriptional regulator with XRE-family HTH domain
MADNGGQSRRDAVALELAKGRTIRDVAAATGVSERTISRWLQKQKFRQRLDILHGEMFRQAVGKLADRAGGAVDALYSLMEATKSESVRLACIKVVLEYGPRLRESSELAAKLETLRELIAEKEKGHGAQSGNRPATEAGPEVEAAGSIADPGQDQARPCERDGTGGDTARPVASPRPSVFGPEDDVVGDTAGGEVDLCLGTRAAHSFAEA